MKKAFVVAVSLKCHFKSSRICNYRGIATVGVQRRDPLENASKEFDKLDSACVPFPRSDSSLGYDCALISLSLHSELPSFHLPLAHCRIYQLRATSSTPKPAIMDRYSQRPHFSAPPLAFNASRHHEPVAFDDDAEWSHMMEHALPVRLRRSSSADIPIPQFMIPCSANTLMNKRYALSSPDKAASVPSADAPTALRKP